jgi:hypothetical protein
MSATEPEKKEKGTGQPVAQPDKGIWQSPSKEDTESEDEEKED